MPGYKLCEPCNLKVTKNEEGKYICPVCKKEVKKTHPIGWGHS